MEKQIKVLNLFCGLGGNRKLWSNCRVTAIDNDNDKLKFYKDHFPGDETILCDAYEFLLKNYNKYDFIWTSNPCPSHSRARFWASKPNLKIKPVYPDFRLYETIVFLKHYFKGSFVVENVIPFYEPMIKPNAKIGRHLFWSNFYFPSITQKGKVFKKDKIKDLEKDLSISIKGYNFSERKDKILRNCVHPKIGKHIFDYYLSTVKPELKTETVIQKQLF